MFLIFFSILVSLRIVSPNALFEKGCIMGSTVSDGTCDSEKLENVTIAHCFLSCKDCAGVLLENRPKNGIVDSCEILSACGTGTSKLHTLAKSVYWKRKAGESCQTMICPEPIVPASGLCLFALPDMTLDDCRLECANSGGKLVEINSEAHWLKIRAWQRNAVKTGYWVANPAPDCTNPPHMLLADGTPVPDFPLKYWVDGEPSGPDEKCIISLGGQDGKFNDGTCDTKRRCICHIEDP